jgi:CYTH domain-containing protein
MGQEIERKFLLKNDQWRTLGTGLRYCQGYIMTQQQGKTVRVRIAGDRGFLTLKNKSKGFSRAEFEYEIPLADAQTLLETLCDSPLIDKIRYKIPIDPLVWEVDEFLGDNAGLIMAEVELTTETDAIAIPDWIGEEVTGDPRYYNSTLAQNPYKNWSKI